MTNLRIKGLVAAMNHARDGWRHGVRAAEAPAFRQMVQATVAQAEQICRRHRVAPRQLPAPSYRAYCYLKSLDLAALPICDEARTPPARAVRIKNAVALANRTRTELLALPGRAVPAALARPPVSELLRRVQANVHAIEEICRKHHNSPANLPAPSRRAYQWLKYLSAPDNLLAHWATLALGREIIANLRWLKQRFGAYQFEFEIYPSDYLYRAQVNHTQVRISAAPGFVGAPPDVLEALLRASLSRQKGAHQAVKRYMSSEDFAEASTQFELNLETPDGAVQGRHYDLAQVFARVNAAHFGGKLPRPRLEWSRTVTARTMGHYQVESDTLMLSIALDSAEVPAFVIDFVMYHELLHKQLGVQFVDGRRYAHTPAFRAAERKFRRFAEAEAFLRALARER